jgi:menaquinone-dependent protoporphyrinogen IX oxidase
MMAWRLFAQYGDLQDLAGPRIRLREYKYLTRAATARVLSHETEFANFVKKGAAIYNLMGKEITASKSKEQAKSRMKKDFKEIEKSVDKLCLQQSSQ